MEEEDQEESSKLAEEYVDELLQEILTEREKPHVGYPKILGIGTFSDNV